MNGINNNLNPRIIRQVLFFVSILSIYLITVYFFGFLIGSIVNTVLIVALMFYIRRNQNALKLFGFSGGVLGGKTEGTFGNQNIKIRYSCMSCGVEVKNVNCQNCGSRIKKPIF